MRLWKDEFHVLYIPVMTSNVWKMSQFGCYLSHRAKAFLSSVVDGQWEIICSDVIGHIMEWRCKSQNNSSRGCAQIYGFIRASEGRTVFYGPLKTLMYCSSLNKPTGNEQCHCTGWIQTVFRSFTRSAVLLGCSQFTHTHTHTRT